MVRVDAGVQSTDTSYAPTGIILGHQNETTGVHHQSAFCANPFAKAKVKFFGDGLGSSYRTSHTRQNRKGAKIIVCVVNGRRVYALTKPNGSTVRFNS